MTEQIDVLDKGFVQFVEGMGFDAGVVDAARVCYASKGDPERDKKLVRYLLDNKHETPFEHAVLKFHVKAPVFVARQWFRHRSSSYNEASQRYAEVKDDFYIPSKWRAQDVKNKQGSVPAPDLDQAMIDEAARDHSETSIVLYRRLLAQGVAREMARMILPTNAYTEWFWTVNARNLMAFIRLRSEAHAQWEIRQYSNALWRLFASRMPWTAEAFLDTLLLARYAAIDGIAGPCRADIQERQVTAS